MFDTRQSAVAPRAALGTSDLAVCAEALRAMPVAADEAEHVARLRLLEELKAVCAAVQARETAALHTARRDAEAAHGVPARERCRGLGAEVALARRDSPARGSRHLGLALALTEEMPRTMTALTAGMISEWRTTLVARETAWLPAEGRSHVDEVLAPALTGAGDRAVAAHARALAQAFDPAAAAAHLAYAARDRRVSIRPAPDAGVRLSALLPTPAGVAAYAALHRDTAETTATGKADGRTRSQVMADLLVERLTGQASAGAVPVEIHLIMTDTTLRGADRPDQPGRPSRPGHDEAAGSAAPDVTGSAATDPAGTGPALAGPALAGPAPTGPPDASGTPAWLVGHGPIPAPTARSLLDPAHDDATRRARVWVRRLYTHPETGHLVAMDSQRRVFDGQLRRMVVLRDDTCRTPWCDAPIRHADHVAPHHGGGTTSYINASGLCEACNHTKENDGWRHRATADGLRIETPTGHSYAVATRPLLPGRAVPRGGATPPGSANTASPARVSDRPEVTMLA